MLRRHHIRIPRRITAAHRGGVPAMVIHCSMHSYRAATVDDWREFLGVTSRRHTRAFNIPVRIAAKDHAVMSGFKADWVTPVDELYVIEKLWPNAKALATAVSPEDQTDTRSCGSTNTAAKRESLAPRSGTATTRWNDPVYEDLLTRGFNGR